MHHHASVFNALLYGKKLWAITPPASSAFAPRKEHPIDSEWYAEWSRMVPRGVSTAASTVAAAVDAAGTATAAAAAPRSSRRSRYRFCIQKPGSAIFLPSQWAHATLNLEEGAGVGGFLQEAGSAALHMQLLHAPRGIGSLQDAALRDEAWYGLVSRAFPA